MVGTLGLRGLTVEIDESDGPSRVLLADHGFTSARTGVVEAWLVTDARSPTARLADGYQRSTRPELVPRPHHMIGRSGPDVEARLRQTSLYRPELDIVVLDGCESVAAYGLFWFDPRTATGLVEPMRTEDGHQRRGLARHILGTGLELLATAGATRVKVCFAPDNTAARDLYLGAGFAPGRRTVVLAR